VNAVLGGQELGTPQSAWSGTQVRAKLPVDAKATGAFEATDDGEPRLRNDRGILSAPWKVRIRKGRGRLAVDFGGYVCSEQALTVTCTVKAGAAAGAGFRVSPSAAEALAASP
jgi:hypothetical protein